MSHTADSVIMSIRLRLASWPALSCFVALLAILMAAEPGLAQDEGLRRFNQLIDDINTAGAFCDDYDRGFVGLRKDESPANASEAPMILGKPPYGYLFVCSRAASSCRFVNIRPAIDVAEHYVWLLQTDFQSVVDFNHDFGAKLVDASQDPQDSSSVWKRLTAIYCREKPQGFFVDLDHSPHQCQVDH